MKYSRVLHRLLYSVVLVLIALAIWGWRRSRPWDADVFAFISAFIGYLVCLADRNVHEYSKITVKIGDRNVEAHDAKGNVIK